MAKLHTCSTDAAQQNKSSAKDRKTLLDTGYKPKKHKVKIRCNHAYYYECYLLTVLVLFYKNVLRQNQAFAFARESDKKNVTKACQIYTKTEQPLCLKNMVNHHTNSNSNKLLVGADRVGSTVGCFYLNHYESLVD